MGFRRGITKGPHSSGKCSALQSAWTLVALLLAACAAPPVAKVEIPALPGFAAVGFDALPGWTDDDMDHVQVALLQSCRALGARLAWREICQAVGEWLSPSAAEVRRFFETRFTPYRILGEEGSDQAFLTGYFEPVLQGSRRPSAIYRYPVYRAPDDLVSVELAGLYPELAKLRLRGRLAGRKLVPYFSRAEIDADPSPLAGNEILWVDDPLELFFLQVQGSGRVLLEDGRRVRLGYADQNGHPYRPIGRWLVEQGMLSPDQVTMRSIKDWAREHPEQSRQLMNYNPSYVFFREIADDLPGPLGSLGVSLTAARSIAVDPRWLPLGAPVYLATTWPGSDTPLNRLVFAQDTGGAIKGRLRADFFWGTGPEAGERAGAMKQAGRLWLLLPRSLDPVQSFSRP